MHYKTSGIFMEISGARNGRKQRNEGEKKLVNKEHGLNDFMSRVTNVNEENGKERKQEMNVTRSSEVAKEELWRLEPD